MSKAFAAIVAALSLLVAAESRACHPVQAITSYQSAAFVAPVVAPIVYQPQVVQQFVAQPVSYSVVAPVVQQQIIVRQRVRVRHPVRNTLRVVLPPYGCGR